MNSLSDSNSPVNPDPIPEEVIKALAAIRESGLTNMFARSTVIALAYDWGFHEPADWLNEHKNRYMDALNEMGKLVRS